MEFQKIEREDLPKPPLEQPVEKEAKLEDFTQTVEASETLGATVNTDRNLDAILGISVDIQVVLGSASMLVSNLLKLGRGAVIPLDHRVGEPVEVVVNGRVVARGEVIVVEDDSSRFGVSLTEIVGAGTSPSPEAFN
ncbi:flagellar motor switch protein FliN [Cohaesibacter celericrescens]|uniref:Flagellar motor switch protein FliN n=2 Tax=Cohaesibacter celericrescens TaxID=2067669 RepID=A0A2N5XM58_9HYPH|nr:flagellar motor switch protein FliN [Cohaesibacter celericrescens]PLW79258.1 flagellar motor switch protein FliN [Cohaesibacter celericrescens]